LFLFAKRVDSYDRIGKQSYDDDDGADGEVDVDVGRFMLFMLSDDVVGLDCWGGLLLLVVEGVEFGLMLGFSSSIFFDILYR
jgi:hypothetical protein